jgi:hypothetical protein
MLQTLKLNTEKQKKCSFYKEKSLVELTPVSKNNKYKKNIRNCEDKKILASGRKDKLAF